MLETKLHMPLHDLATISLGDGKVMILGGHNEKLGPSKKVEIRDMVSESI
jgi:hypothetical protein